MFENSFGPEEFPPYSMVTMEAGKKSVLWIRLGCVLISVAALIVLFQRLKLSTLIETVRTMRPGWFIAAVALNGLAFVPAAWRWHLVLRLTGNSAHAGASARLSLIGHFFYTLLFGAPGGDSAKAILYARWYKFPLAAILATAPLDRFLGSGGLMVFSLLVLLWAGSAGAFAKTTSLSLERPHWWILGLVIIAIVSVFLLRGRGPSAWRNFVQALSEGAKRLLAYPRVAVSGVFCGFLVHVLLNGVLAFNLQAVCQEPVPWDQMLWTFPVIAIVSALPISVAGLGTREGASLFLFGLYGIPAASAVAASLLTLSAALIWALIGGLILWRETGRQRQLRPDAKGISVVIPTLNEATSIEETIRRAQAVPEISEILVVDAGSIDGTQDIAKKLGCRVISASASRGGQLNAGATQATAGVILLLHADTWVPPDAGKAILNCLRDTAVVGGGFWKVFQKPSLWLGGSRFKCAIRLCLGRRIAADQAIFVRREVLKEIGGVPALPLMEEFELCKRLNKVGRLALAGATVETSARRFARLGIARTYLRMWRVMLSYYLGTEPSELKRLYEKE